MRLREITGIVHREGARGAAVARHVHREHVEAGVREIRHPAVVRVRHIERHFRRYARTVHEGSYELLGDAWARFTGQWLPSSGERLGDGLSYEIYLNTPMEVAEQQLRTELYLPLR